MLTFHFNGAEGIMTVPEILTSGMVGKQVRLLFSPEWEGLRKNVVYTAGHRTVVHTDVTGQDTIPAEVLEKPLGRLYVAVYGVSADGKQVIPTIRAEGPGILPGADPAGDAGTEPELPVWAQLQNAMGDLSQLCTRRKDTLVEAINEAVESCAGGESGRDGTTFYPAVTADGVLFWSNDGGLENPPAVDLTGPAGEDGYSPVRGVDYWTDADKAEIRTYVDAAILGGAW